MLFEGFVHLRGFCSSYYIFISTTLQNICLNHGMEKPSTLAIMIGVASVLTPLGWIRRIGSLVERKLHLV